MLSPEVEYDYAIASLGNILWPCLHTLPANDNNDVQTKATNWAATCKEKEMEQNIKARQAMGAKIKEQRQQARAITKQDKKEEREQKLQEKEFVKSWKEKEREQRKRILQHRKEERALMNVQKAFMKQKKNEEREQKFQEKEFVKSLNKRVKSFFAFIKTKKKSDKEYLNAQLVAFNNMQMKMTQDMQERTNGDDSNEDGSAA